MEMEGRKYRCQSERSRRQTLDQQAEADCPLLHGHNDNLVMKLSGAGGQTDPDIKLSPEYTIEQDRSSGCI